MNEFELIQRFFHGLTSARQGVDLGIGDDAALLTVATGKQLVVSTDTLVAGRHFPSETTPFDIGWKSLAVNLSDIAAMGAVPRWCTLALSLPEADAGWLEGFRQGFRELADRAGIGLIGGDTTRGPLSITVTALGEVPRGAAVLRSGARAGDCICVTGTLGDAAAGLRGMGADKEARWLLARLDRPEPRLDCGARMRGIAHAAIDLSDGLAGDLGHILAASQVGADLQADALPTSDALLACGLEDLARWQLQLFGGDDYELCLSVPPERVEALKSQLDVPLTVVGKVTAQPGLRIRGPDGVTIQFDQTAYRHFP